MSLKFYMDHHVRGAVTKQLRRRGIDILTTEEDGTTELQDDLFL